MTSENERKTAEQKRLLLDDLIKVSRNRLYQQGEVPCTELVIAGPSCSGKTMLGAYAAGMLRYHFVEGDLFHLHQTMQLARDENIPMTDEYRESDWFHSLSGGLLFAALQHMEIVLTCSALKRTFRNKLTNLGGSIGMGDLWIVWLDLPPDVLKDRAAKRQRETNHPFGPEMMDSQLADAEVPQANEDRVIVVNGLQEPPQLLQEIVARIPGLPAIGV